MLNGIITWSLGNRLVVIAMALLLAGAGVYSLLRLPIDAFPDTTPVQVQVNTVAPSLSPVEVEGQITAAVEATIAGLPGLTEVRSISKFGLSQVTATFEDGTDLYFARQLVNERLGAVELPRGVERPEVGPAATGLGEIFQYLVTGEGRTLEELTTVHDWIIKPQLRSVPGVAEINTWGGERRQYHVLVDPALLVKFDLTLDDLAGALAQNNTSVGGGNVVQAGELHLVRGVSLAGTVEHIASITIVARDGVPVRVGDVATVEIGHEIRRGAATAQGQGEVVLGLGYMLTGENSHAVAGRLRARLLEIGPSLPAGVVVTIVYDRTGLVDEVIGTVRRNLLEGAVLVVAVLFAFLGSLRAGLIVALSIPLSMLCAFSAMLQFGVTASLLSLGAIDFGLVVDSSVIMVENSVRRLGQDATGRPVADVVRDAALEVRRPTMFGELIIMIVYLPILLLEGVEGKLFRPMALTVIFALGASLVLSLTLMPVLASLGLRRPAAVGAGAAREHRDNVLVRGAQRLYRPLVRLSLRFPVTIVLLSGLLLAGGAWGATRLGAEFIPRLSEMAITINTVRLAGVSLEESVRYGGRIEQVILERFPDEVRDAWSRTGTAEVATDPMGIEVTDVFLTLHPRARWTSATTQAELVEAMSAVLAGMPGMRTIFTQPVEMRMNEMTAGIRADLGIKIFGDDFDALVAKAAEVQRVLESIPGSADLYTEQITGQPVLEIEVDQEAIARYGVPAAHVLEMVEAVGGITVGQVREGQRRFDLVLRLAESYRDDPNAVGRALVPTASGERLPLSRLAHIRQTEGPSTITREWQNRRVVVQCNVRGGRDLGGFVEEARRRIAAEVELPPGYFISFGGQYELLQRAATRLMIVIPIALASILFLLYLSTGSVRDSLIIFSGAPFAALGGVAALWLRDMPFTIAAGIGFVAVSGVSMLNGLVLVSTIKQRLEGGAPLRLAIEETRLIRLRPILMTALVAALGFVPMALNTGVGAEVQRPLATVVIGGVISDNLLTLLVLPALYSLFGSGRAAREASPVSPARGAAAAGTA